MSDNKAVVNEVYNGWCANCCDGAGPFDYHDDAEAWANEHNKLNHEP